MKKATWLKMIFERRVCPCHTSPWWNRVRTVFTKSNSTCYILDTLAHSPAQTGRPVITRRKEHEPGPHPKFRYSKQLTTFRALLASSIICGRGDQNCLSSRWLDDVSGSIERLARDDSVDLCICLVCIGCLLEVGLTTEDVLERGLDVGCIQSRGLDEC
jgi:hypothetical protein